jgi:hypothetical protein
MERTQRSDGQNQTASQASIGSERERDFNHVPRCAVAAKADRLQAKPVGNDGKSLWIDC